MTGEEWKKVLAIIDDRIARQTSSPQRLRDVLGDAYIDELETLSDAQAIEYLRTVDESKLAGAYHVLSKRLTPGVLAEICGEYITRSSFRVRLIGVSGIGIWLRDTHHRESSVMLLAIVRDVSEHPAIRWAAYQSLERIYKGESSVYKALLNDPTFWDRPMSTWLERIDWSFVDSLPLGPADNEDSG